MASRRPFDCEFPRTPDREASLADTTAFFDDLQLDDDGCHVLRSVTGEEIRLGADDNVPVELQRVPRASTPVDLNTTVQSEFDVEETEVEVSEIPRGYDPDTLCGNEGVGHLVKPSFQDEKTEISVNGKKAEQFVKDLTENPEWARSIQYVKLNAAMPKEILLNLINHLYGNVNDRPKYLTLLSKLIDEDDLPHFIKLSFYKAFESNELPHERSLFRLCCRNPVPNFKSLLNAFVIVLASTPNLLIEYSTMYGEMVRNKSSFRMDTSDLKAFCQVEEQGRKLGMRFLTTFSIRSKFDNKRTLHIRYYDELKKSGERVTYLHFDHEAVNDRGVVFSEKRNIITFDVENEMTPLFLMQNPTYDLIDLIVRLSCERPTW